VVHALSMNRHPVPPGLTLHVCTPRHTPDLRPHRPVADLEAKVIRGEAAAQAMLAPRHHGFMPDLVAGLFLSPRRQ